MAGRFFYDADGELLLVPQLGRLRIATELGVLDVEPQQVAVVPRGIRFRVELPDGPSRGYVLENFGAPLRLPELGPIGANGLANPRDFETPVAAYEDVEGQFELVAKFQGHLWRADIGHSPLDVVAWHGNYAPYRYDLRRFNAIGSISFDHPDPSIFTAHRAQRHPGHGQRRLRDLPAALAGGAAHLPAALVPPQRGQRVHGPVHGAYDAKAEGFPARRRIAAQLHERARPGCDHLDKASAADLSRPDVIADTMAFMFETRAVIRPCAQALAAGHRQRGYQACWATCGATSSHRRNGRTARKGLLQRGRAVEARSNRRALAGAFARR